MKNIRRCAAIFAALALAGCQTETPGLSERSAAQAQAQETAPAETVETIDVTIRTAGGEHVFEAETAITAEEQRRGLMFRESLPVNGGMIFPFAYPRLASFWMRNTVIPLDMIFIRADGTIANIARMTEPYTLDSHVSEGPVIAVLEIRGGRSAELGIEAGDVVSWPGGPAFDE